MRRIKIETIKRKVEQRIKDPRRTEYGNIRHKLWEMIVISLCSTICQGADYGDMEDFGVERERWLKEELGLELANGIPSEDTFRRLFEAMNPKEFRSCLDECIGYTRSEREVVNIDGKAKKSGGIHVISAFVGENGITLGEIKSESKRGEIKEIPKLLEQIYVKGSIVTIDSIGCQHEILKKTISKKADYVIGLKRNQKNLYKAVENRFNEGVRAYNNTRTVESGHGRFEVREYYLETDLNWLETRDDWTGLKSVGMVRSCTFRKGKSSVAVRYFITSLTDIDEFAHSVREHWAIENKLHWSLDVLFREDSDVARKDNAPLNLNILDKMSLYLVSQLDLGKVSRKRKRYRAALNPDVLKDVILCQK
jgi:predicted transposase YbfD/YdcC